MCNRDAWIVVMTACGSEGEISQVMACELDDLRDAIEFATDTNLLPVKTPGVTVHAICLATCQIVQLGS